MSKGSLDVMDDLQPIPGDSFPLEGMRKYEVGKKKKGVKKKKKDIFFSWSVHIMNI